MYLLPLWLACSAGPSPDKTASDTSAGDTSAGDTGAGDTGVGDTGAGDTSASLYGTLPPEALPLPSFAALSERGEARGPADLQGHPTVLWFFPFVGTPG